LVFSYINTLADKGNYTFHVITFEQEKYGMNEKEKNDLKYFLLKKGIYWYPQNFLTGRYLLAKKILNFFSAFMVVKKIVSCNHTRFIFTFTNIAASFGIIFSKIFRLPMLVYSYEPHSEFMRELGLWSGKDPKYLLLNFLEKYVRLNSDYILTGTEYMVNALKKFGAKGKLIKAPSSVDHQTYCFDPKFRQIIRDNLKIRNRKVLLYLGKFGGLYYSKEIANFCRILYDLDPNFFFLIVTPTDKAQVTEYFIESGFRKKDFHITEAHSQKEVIRFISSSDIGLTAIPPTPSQKYRSPVKVAEYLMCGIPYITCKGISEDDLYAEQNNIGVVFNSLDENDVLDRIGQINELLKESKDSLRKRCREVGIEYRAKSNVDKILREIFQEVFHSKYNIKYNSKRIH